MKKQIFSFIAITALIMVILASCKSATKAVREPFSDDIEQSIAIDSALHDNSSEVTLEKSTNQSTISYVAVNDRDPEVRIAALEKSTNQSTISSVAVNDRDPKVRIAALEKSTNQSTISSVAVNDRDPEVRIAALKLLK